MTLKTRQTPVTVKEFINTLPDEETRQACNSLNDMFERITSQEGKMWGSSIAGYGTYSYTRSDGKFYEYMATGFSPRKNALTIYNIPGYDHEEVLMSQLGKFTTGKSCLYVKKLSDIDLEVLEKVMKNGYDFVAGKHLDYKTGTWTKTV